MLTKVDVTTRRGTTLSLDVFENDSGYQVIVEGLDPVKAELSSSPNVGQDGEDFQFARRGPRQIKLKFDLIPDFDMNTYASLRDNLYSYLMPTSFVKLRFYKNTGLYVDIDAVVEDHSSPMDSEDPEVEVVLMCFKPDLVNPIMVEVDGSTVSDSTITEINYPGNIQTGTVVTLHINRDVSGFTIYNSVEEGILSQLDFDYALISGDELVISSIPGSKGINLTRSGVMTSVLYGRSSQSSWINFQKGINEFRVYTPGDPVPFSLGYFERYGGL